jgi:hypothetical protein
MTSSYQADESAAERVLTPATTSRSSRRTGRTHRRRSARLFGATALVVLLAGLAMGATAASGSKPKAFRPLFVVENAAGSSSSTTTFNAPAELENYTGDGKASWKRAKTPATSEVPFGKPRIPSPVIIEYHQTSNGHWAWPPNSGCSLPDQPCGPPDCSKSLNSNHNSAELTLSPSGGEVVAKLFVGLATGCAIVDPGLDLVPATAKGVKHTYPLAHFKVKVGETLLVTFEGTDHAFPTEIAVGGTTYSWDDALLLKRIR